MLPGKAVCFLVLSDDYFARQNAIPDNAPHDAYMGCGTRIAHRTSGAYSAMTSSTPRPRPSLLMAFFWEGTPPSPPLVAVWAPTGCRPGGWNFRASVITCVFSKAQFDTCATPHQQHQILQRYTQEHVREQTCQILGNSSLMCVLILTVGELCGHCTVARESLTLPVRT